MQNTKLWYGIQNTKILKARWNAKCKIQTNRKLVGIKIGKLQTSRKLGGIQNTIDKTIANQVLCKM